MPQSGLGLTKSGVTGPCLGRGLGHWIQRLKVMPRHIVRKWSCTVGCFHVFSSMSWLGWWFLRCLLRLLRRELQNGEVQNCLHKNEAAGNSKGQKPNQKPQTPQSCNSDIFGICGAFRNTGCALIPPRYYTVQNHPLSSPFPKVPELWGSTCAPRAHVHGARRFCSK